MGNERDGDGMRGSATRLWRPMLAASVLLAALAAVPGAASAETLSAHYDIDLLGMKIGDLRASGTLQPQTYRMDLSAHLTGLAAMMSDVQMALASTGAVSKRGTLAPSSYATSAVNAEDTRTLRMALSAGTVKAVEITPPPEFHGERVPVSEANKRNILDPTSALIMPVPANEALVGPAACARTLPIYDGYARFDIALSYVGERQVNMGGYAGPVAVCSARYRPISGHLVNSRGTAFMAQATGIEVWLAPVEHAHMVVPLRVSMPTMAGQLDVEATDFQLADSGQATH